MAQGQIRMTLTQAFVQNGKQFYRVEKAVNVTSPKVGKEIGEDEVKDYIDQGREVTIIQKAKR